MDLGLRGLTFLVTGGSRGLGYATARALVSDGANVLITGRDPQVAERAARELGPAAAAMVADNADPGTPDRLIDGAITSFGRLDGALISVGGPPRGGPRDPSADQWRTAFESVFLGAVRLASAVATELERPRPGPGTAGGAIALVLSSSVRVPIDGLAISNGLRPGLAMWAKSLADEVGPRGIRVISLLPGTIATERTAAIVDGPGRAAAEAAVPLRRIGTPEEFGRVAAFALSPAASYGSGSTITVDGGSVRSL